MVFNLSAEAFIFTPMVKHFPPKGKGRVQTFYLENKKPEKVAVQITLYKRGIDKRGEETRTPTDLLSVFPEQVILMPDQKRTVRVTWNGPEEVPVEEAFRLVAEQMPVELQSKKPEKSGIQFLMKYVASIYIQPENPKANVVLLKNEAVKVKKAAAKREKAKAAKAPGTPAAAAPEIPEPEEYEHLLSLTLKNEGNAHQVLNSMWVEIKQKVVKLVKGKKGRKIKKEELKTVRIQGKDVKTLVSANLLPGAEKSFLIPWPTGLQFGPAEVEIGFNN